MAKRKKKRNNKKKIRKKIKRRLKKSKINKKNKISYKKTSKETKDQDGNLVFKVPEKWSKQALVNKSQYEKKYKLFF